MINVAYEKTCWRSQQKSMLEERFIGFCIAEISFHEDDIDARTICGELLGQAAARGTSSPTLRTDVLFRIYELI